MSSTLLLSDFDLPTRSASGFLLRWIVPRIGLEPASLYGVLARKFPFDLAAPRSDIIIAMGHGDEDTLTGQNETVILDAGKYDSKLVKGKVVRLLACQVAKKLGPDIISNGATAFIGSLDDFVWVCDADLSSTPWSDKMAAEVLMPVVDSLNALLDGKTCGEAYSIERSGYLRNAVDEENELIKACLEFNYDNLVLLGDPTARVKARPRISFPIPPPPLLPSALMGVFSLGLLLPFVPPPP